MASDAVQAQLEAQLPELEDLQQRNLFSKRELQQLVRSRAQHERALRRRSPTRADFLKYIKHELDTERLRRHRAARNGRLTGATARAPVKGTSNRSIVRRIIFLYSRATRSFRGDLSLWRAYFDFCNAAGASRALSRALATALSLHPNNPGLWAYAAWHFFKTKCNTPNARAILQRGLRLNPQSHRLWLTYFRLELAHAHWLHSRRSVLGLPVGGEEENKQADDNDEQDEDAVIDSGFGNMRNELATALREDGNDQHTHMRQSSSAAKPELARVLRGAAASVVMHTALSTLEDYSADTVHSFAEVAAEYSNARSVLHEALSFLRDDFARKRSNVRAVQLLAHSWLSTKLQLEDPAQCTCLEMATSEFEDAIASTEAFNMKTPLWEAYTQFVEEQSRLEHLSAEEQTKLVEFCLSICERVVPSQTTTAILETHTRCLLRLGRQSDAQTLLESAGSKVLSHLSETNCRLASLKLKVLSTPDRALSDATAALTECAKAHLHANAAFMPDCSELWITAVEVCAAQDLPLNDILHKIAACIARGAAVTVERSASALLDAECARNGRDGVQHAIDTIIGQPSVPQALLWHCVELERSLGSSLIRIERLAELSVSRFGASDVASWLILVETELARGCDGSKALWRAQKSLPADKGRVLAQRARGMIGAAAR